MNMVASPELAKSALARSVDGIRAELMTGLQWLDSVRGLVNKGLAKQDEVERSGLGEWLAIQSDKLTKEDVQQYLAGVAGEPAKTGLSDTLAFKTWFTDSKAVDSTGKPLMLYHGTNKEFSVFKAIAGPRSKMVGDWEGIHFTNDREQAQSIAESLARSEGGTARVVEAYLQAKNPVPFGTYRTKEQALAAGHDSRLTENNVGLQEWTVFDPSQVTFATEHNTELAAQSGTTDTTPSGAPVQEHAYAQMDDYHRAYRDQYRYASSRDTPSSIPVPEVGSWFIDSMRGLHGRLIEQVVHIPVGNIEISEDTGSQKHGDVKRYAQWIIEGKQAPPISLTQTDKGTLKTHDHRRLLAAKAAGLSEILARVSWTDSDGHGLTFESAQQGCVPIPITKARPDYTIHANDVWGLDRIKGELEQFKVELQARKLHESKVRDQVQSDAFKHWFGDSKVVDADGKPLTVYRGDRPGKTVFTGHEKQSNYLKGNIFFSDNPLIGRFYTEYRTQYMVRPDSLGVDDGLYRVYLALSNPLIIDAQGEDWMSIPVPKKTKLRYAFTGARTVQIDDLGVLAQQAGYDGLIVHNVLDQAGPGTQYVAFSPTQIKSVNDNNGEFSPTNPDIRFSQIKETTELPSDEAVTDTPAFRNWFGGSQVVDADGKPLVVYHGTSADFDHFDLTHTFFAGDASYANDFAKTTRGSGDRVIPVYLSVKKPLDLRSLGLHDLKLHEILDALTRNGMGASKLVQDLSIYDGNGNQGPIFEFVAEFGDELVDAAKQAGFDGLIQHEENGTNKTVAYIAFNPEQIKSATGNIGEFSPKNPDIRFSVIAAPTDTPSHNPAIYTATPSFVRALKPVKDAIYSELLETTDAGPFDGGCVVFADSLKSVIGGAVVVLTNKSGRGDHAAVELDGKLYDFDGPLAPQQFMARFAQNEHVEIAGYRPIEDRDLPDAPKGINGRIVSLLKQAFGMKEVAVQVSLKDSFDIPELQRQLAAVEAKYERLRALKTYSDAEWDAIRKEAAPISHRLFELTGDGYGNPSSKQVKPSDSALEAEYGSPDEVPADVRLWVLKNASLLYSDATDAVRWGRIEDTLRADRYPSGDLPIYRAVADGDDIRPGDWVTTDPEYAQVHLAKSLGGRGHILEETVDGRDVLISPTGNAEEAIYAPRSLSGPVKTRPIASKPKQAAKPEVTDTGTGLRSALLQSIRQTRWGPFPDPIAENIASAKSFDGLENALQRRGIQGLKPLSGGASHVVLDAGETVIRLGFGKAEPRPKIPELLQATDTLNVGNIHFEILPKVDTTSLNEEDVQSVVDALRERGYSWGDAGVDNIGRYKGQLLAIDPGGIALAPDHDVINAQVKSLTKAIVGPQETTQQRAKVGGEIGPNGEWYKGGAFIATTDLPKATRQWFAKNTKTGKVQIDYYEAGENAKSDPRVGEFPTYRVASIVLKGPNGPLNEGYLNALLTHYPRASAEYVDGLRELSNKFIAGERWAKVADYPELAYVEDLVRMIAAGQAIPGDALKNFPEKIQANFRKAASITPPTTPKDGPDIRFSKVVVAEQTLGVDAWFDGSVIVDDHGAPLVVYHGTQNEFGEFSIGHDTQNHWEFGSYITRRKAAFFAEDKSHAKSFAKKDGKTLEVYLKVTSLLDLTDGYPNEFYKKHHDMLTENNLLIMQPHEMWEMFDDGYPGAESFVAAIKEDGYDGVKMSERSSDGRLVNVYAVFDPAQIKNVPIANPEYNPDEPDIRHSQVAGPIDVDRQVKSLKKAVVGPQETTQQRAKVGGEIGPNGEWYKGGAFIATKDLPKATRQWFAKNTKTGQVQIDFYHAGANVRADPRVGEFPLLREMHDVLLGPKGPLNEPRLAYLLGDGSPESTRLVDGIRQFAEKFIAGERWAKVNDYPEFANIEDLVRMIVAGQAIPGEALNKFSEKIQDNFRQVGSVTAPATPKTVEFKTWFEGSAVVDAAGQPLLVYHGTRRAFDTFEPMNPRGAPGNPKGIYFTADRRTAEEHAQDVDGAFDEKSRVIAAYLSISTEQDGLIKESGYTGTEYVVFDTTKIQVVDANIGQMDLVKPDLRHSVALVGTEQKAGLDAWFQGSAVLDTSGKPLVVYHGTTATRTIPGTTIPGDAQALAELQEFADQHGIAEASSVPSVFERWVSMGMAAERGVTPDMAVQARSLYERSKPTFTPHRVELAFDEFAFPGDGKELGVHFGTLHQASALGEAFPFLLSIKNPLEMPDMGTWDYQHVMRDARWRGVPITQAEFDAVVNATDNNAALRDLLTLKGYDGVVYINKAEGHGKSYIAFHPEQIRPAVASDPSAQMHIAASVATTSDPAELDEMQRRIEQIPKLRNSAGPAYTFWQLANTAIKAAGGDPQAVDWSLVEQSTIETSIRVNGQSPRTVEQALSRHSPGAVNALRQQAIVEATHALVEQHKGRQNLQASMSNHLGSP